MTLIDLSDQEMKLVQKFAKQRDITINQAAQIIFDAGKEQVLAIASPTTAIIRKMRAQ
jgi:phosphoribosyl-dephospho-CoA transferase